MKAEKRNHQRHKPRALKVDVTFNSAVSEMALDAEILDISYSGIRVKLKEAIACDINGPVKITMKLPDSGMPFSVHGIIKHQHSDMECGVHYVDHVDGSIDDLLFECIDLDSSTLLIKAI